MVNEREEVVRGYEDGNEGSERYEERNVEVGSREWRKERYG